MTSDRVTSDRVQGELHVLGVRHHGPGSARSVERALDEIVPDRVLVELPADAQAAVGFAARDDLVPPVALLGYVPDRPECAAFHPFARFSPEWTALRWSARHGVEVRAIDLPLAHTLAARDSTLFGDSAPVDPLGELARAAGDDDAERWWEDVVEHRGDGEGAFAAVAEAMRAVRATSLVDERDLVREAHMRKVIRAALADSERVVVVCGAWHVPALELPFPSAASDTGVLRGLAKVKVACTWVPWTHRRLAAATGYGAGVRAPGWYAHVYDHPGDAGLTRWFAEAGAALRGAGHQASPDHLIAGVRTAGALAALRGRPRAGLDEVLDAAVTVMGEGRHTPLVLLHDRLVVGSAIGSVPVDTPMVPLAKDLMAQQSSCRLKPTADRRVVELDLRTPAGRARSRLLHRTVTLGIGWAVLTEGRGSSGTFRETWEVTWEPEASVRVIERSALGTTVESAASTRLIELSRSSSQVLILVGLVEQALLGDLPGVVPALVDRVASAAATAPDLSDVMDALVPLARTARYGDTRGTDLTAVRELIDSLVVRVVAGLDLACRSLDLEASQAMAQRLTAVQSALALVEHPDRHDRWPHALERLARSGTAPLVAGRAARLLHDAEVWDSERTASLLGAFLGRGSTPAEGAAFVEGFLGGGGTVLVHDADMLALLDGWIAGLDAEAFEITVPLLRRTFGGFESAERRRIGEMVSGRARPARRWWADDLDPVRVDVAMTTLRHLLGVPR
jgi:hypothetical protein